MRLPDSTLMKITRFIINCSSASLLPAPLVGRTTIHAAPVLGLDKQMNVVVSLNEGVCS